MRRDVKWVARILAGGVIAAGLAATIVPRYLDRVYYRGPAGPHFDGARFFNPDGDDTAGVPGGGGRAGFLWRQATGGDGRPAWPTRVAVLPAKPAARVDGQAMVATWVGHATVLIQTAGLNILTDPVWSDTAGPFGLGPRRVAAPGIALADLPRIDLIVISHNHYDHLDMATLKRLWDRDRPVIVTSIGNDAILRSGGVPARALDWNATAMAGSARIHVVRNHHWSSRWFADRNRALWSAFVIDTPAGSIFFAGDTGLGDGRWPAEAARVAAGPIRLALIPIGAFRFVPGQMASGAHIGPEQAVRVFQDLGAATAIPIHWGTFRLSYEGWDTPPRLLAAAMACAGENRPFGAIAIGRPVAIPPVGTAPKRSPAGAATCMDTAAVRALR